MQTSDRPAAITTMTLALDCWRRHRRPKMTCIDRMPGAAMHQHKAKLMARVVRITRDRAPEFFEPQEAARTLLDRQ